MLPIPRIKGLADDEQATLARLSAQIDEHSSRNLLRTGLYDGKHAIRQLGSVLPAHYLRTAGVIGWPAQAVDLLARRMVLASVDTLGADGSQLGTDHAWRSNQLAVESMSATTSMLLHGVAFLVASRGSVGEPAGLIHAVEATSGSGDWNARTRRLDTFLSVHSRHSELGWPTSFTLYLPGRTISVSSQRDQWAVSRVETRGPIPVEVLAYRPRAGRRMGSSRITRTVIALTEATMRVAVRMEGNADVYSIPQLVLLGADAKVFRNPDGSPAHPWQVALGNVFGLPDDDDAANPRADVHTIQAASPQPHIEQLRQYAQLFSAATGIPVSSLGVADMANPTSADSYIASREDLISEAEAATDAIAGAWERTMARALAYENGLDLPDERWGLSARFRPPQHLSRSAVADAGTKQLASAPWLAETDVGLELLGLTDDQIKRALSQRNRSRGLDLLERLAVTESAEPDADEAADDAEQ